LIVTKKYLEGLDLGKMPDAPDESRVAVTTGAQTFYGTKTFSTGGRGVADATKAAKSLIVKSEVDNAFTDFPVDRIEPITLTAGDITAQGVTLGAAVPAGFEAAVQFQVNGSDWFFSSIRFDVSGDAISWASYGYTIEKLRAGDVLYVHYIA
jgi:hypothetical protein